METPLTNADAFTCALAARHRVVLLGGMAIIGYGLSRKTRMWTYGSIRCPRRRYGLRS